MADADAGAGLAVDLGLSARTYRHLDRTSKLLGVALVAAGLDAGGATLQGVALGAVGAALAVATVFVRRHDE
ncbi:hypothetical protein [Candidatus Halobonum tyrrellensis]|uniref:DUF8120 domain-containing protein n=1 Tax=Candidatus Halobonum tyrrellensis G22 TaxID=1324957 RepID=V4J389_9EURY|nr:hypothetical protein [Candidatus Halobonum tyrrellensis]ESP89852.1 hypothetical protein K933_02676 [Candidatus Halobonum tyrrellensis G22]